MPVFGPSSPQARERERVLLWKIISPLAAIALVYGFVSARPSPLFVTAFGLIGMAFTAVLRWGNRRKRVRLAMVVAFGIFWFGRIVIEHAFFARPTSDMPWPAYIAELAVFCLGCALAFALSHHWEPTPDKPESNA
ncbi:MAG: hypothetical protein P4L99_29440 [Chthoniobacter sp.]|nr:hypothetical protein [Chthoniobacter sp.]